MGDWLASAAPGAMPPRFWKDADEFTDNHERISTSLPRILDKTYSLAQTLQDFMKYQSLKLVTLQPK